MDWKKGIFGYMVWAVFAVLCGVVLFATFQSAGFQEMFGLTEAMLIACVAGYLLLCTALFFALRRISMEIGAHIRDKEKAKAVSGVVLSVLVILGVVVYLVWYLFAHAPLLLEDDTFYRAALVQQGGGIPFFVHGASYLYTGLLHGMLLLFGNTPFAGVVLQIALFFICLVLLSIGMQSCAGALPAAVSVILFGFFPVSLTYVFSLTPELFYLALYLLGFCMIGTLGRKVLEDKTFSPVCYVLAALAGVFVGFLIWLDICGALLYLFSGALLFADRGKRKRALLANGILLLGGVCGFFLSVLTIFLTGKMDFAQYLTEFVAFHFGKTGILTENILRGLLSMCSLPGGSLPVAVLAVTFAFFIVPAFFLWKKDKNGAFLLQLFFLYGFLFFGVSGLAGEMTLVLGWSMLAGLGIYGILRAREQGVLKAEATEKTKKEKTAKKTVKADSTEKVRSAGEPKKTEALNGKKEAEPAKEQPTEKVRSAGESKKTESVNGKKEAEPVKEQPETMKKEGKSMKEKTEKQVSGKGPEAEKETASKEAAEKKEQEKPAPGKPLHNPLPLPKKKNRGQADFDHSVREADMKFDLDVADDDDFDL